MVIELRSFDTLYNENTEATVTVKDIKDRILYEVTFESKHQNADELALQYAKFIELLYKDAEIVFILPDETVKPKE